MSRRGLLRTHTRVGSAVITVSSPGLKPITADVIVAQPAPQTTVIPSGAVLKVSRTGAVLRMTSETRRIRAGDTVVSGSTGGLLAKVIAVNVRGGRIDLRTVPGSLARAFRSLDVHDVGPQEVGVLTVRNGVATLSNLGGSWLTGAASNEGFTCKPDQPGSLQISLTSGLSFSAPVTFNPILVFQSSWLKGVQFFELGVQISVPVSLQTGSVAITGAGQISETCELTQSFPAPSPVWLGPVEITPTVTASIGLTVSGSESGSVTVAGPSLTQTLAGTYGVQWSPDGGWQALSKNQSSPPTLTPGGTNLTAGFNASLTPFFHVDAGVSAQLAGVFNLQEFDLAFAHADGDLSLSISPPFNYLQAGYEGPTWDAGVTLSAGPELALGKGALSDLWNAIGLEPPSVQWKLLSLKWSLANSPDPQAWVSFPNETPYAPNLAVQFNAQVPSGFAGDRVEFVGYKNGATQGTVLASGTVTGTTATATWLVSFPADNGCWVVPALLFDPLFGPLGLPYASSQPTGVGVDTGC